jgi:hypothetical protein
MLEGLDLKYRMMTSMIVLHFSTHGVSKSHSMAIQAAPVPSVINSAFAPRKCNNTGTYLSSYADGPLEAEDIPSGACDPTHDILWRSSPSLFFLLSAAQRLAVMFRRFSRAVPASWHLRFSPSKFFTFNDLLLLQLPDLPSVSVAFTLLPFNVEFHCLCQFLASCKCESRCRVLRPAGP